MNEQILKFNLIENEPHNAHVYVSYELEGKELESFVHYANLLDHINQRNQLNRMLEGVGIKQVEFDEYDLEYEFPQEVIEESVKDYIKKHIRFDLILENRKLKDRLEKAEIGNRILLVALESFKSIQSKAEKYVSSTSPLTRHLNPYYYRYLAESEICKLAIGVISDLLLWNKNNVTNGR